MTKLLPAQKNCPHRMLDRRGQCSTCGSVLFAGRRFHLSEEWFRYFVSGGAKPAGAARYDGKRGR